MPNRDHFIDTMIAADPGAQITDDQRNITAEHASFNERLQQAGLSDQVDWVHQPAFAEEFWRLTDGEPLTEIDIHLRDEHRREVNWNFTADDGSFT